MIHEVTRGGRTLGYVVVDSTVRGRARGGLRIASALREEEVRLAARAMTLKYGLLGLPQGGAKAGIVGDAEAPPPEKRRLLHEFARAAEPLLRRQTYVPDADLGTTAADIRWMMQSIGLRVAPRDWLGSRSGEYTARSCLVAADVLTARQGKSLRGARVAVEGFGKVGASVALLLERRGATVVAVSTARGALHRPDGLEVADLLGRAAEEGSRFVEGRPETIPREALLELPVDLLLPCARAHSIHSGNVAAVAAKAVCAGANDPVTPEAEQALHERGVAYPPDFMTNCGGVLGGTLEFAGVAPARIDPFIERQLRPRVARLLDQAEEQGVPPRRLAEAEALERHARVRADAEAAGLSGRLHALGLEAYRRRWLPRRPVSVLAARDVVRRMA